MKEMHAIEPVESTTERLWSRFRKDLLRFLERRLPATSDAEDVLQDVFHQIHRQTDRLADVRNIEGWLYSITRHAVADFYRSRKRHPAQMLDELNEESVTATPADSRGVGTYAGPHDVHEEVLSWVRPMIDDLPEMYAVPLRMADVEGRSQQEVADRLGFSLSGAKSRIQRARVLLGESLGRCCDVEFGAEGRAVEFRRLQTAEAECSAEGCG